VTIRANTRIAAIYKSPATARKLAGVPSFFASTYTGEWTIVVFGLAMYVAATLQLHGEVLRCGTYLRQTFCLPTSDFLAILACSV
jgi:hypothetical protein